MLKFNGNGSRIKDQKGLDWMALALPGVRGQERSAAAGADLK